MRRHLVPLLWHLQVILVCFCQISQTFNPSASVKQPPWCVTPDTSLGETHSYKKAQRRNTVEKYTGEIQRRNTVEKKWGETYSSLQCSAIHLSPPTTFEIHSQTILLPTNFTSTSHLSLCHNNMTFFEPLTYAYIPFLRPALAGICAITWAENSWRW